jgi:hypothetical protein
MSFPFKYFVDERRFQKFFIILLTENGSLPGGSGNTIRHNTQNNPPSSNKAQHKNYATINKSTQQ